MDLETLRLNIGKIATFGIFFFLIVAIIIYIIYLKNKNHVSEQKENEYAQRIAYAAWAAILCLILTVIGFI